MIHSLFPRRQREARASLEDPRTNLASPAAWLSESFGASPTSSGVSVNEVTALTYAPVFACLNVLSKDIAQIDANLYERDGLDRDVARDHPIHQLIHDRPNPEMTPFTFKQTLTAHAASWGNGFAEIEYNGAGSPIALWPLLPDRTRIVVTNGAKAYVTRLTDGREVGLPPSSVFHMPGLGGDGLTGWSIIRIAREAIAAGMAAERFSAGYFKRGAIPAVTLTTDKTLSPEARKNLRESWKMQYEGLNNSHRTAILEEGVKVEKIGIPPDDSQFIDTSKFGIEQVARFFDMPLMRLHSTTAITSWGTGLEQWMRGYLVHTLGPWLTLWEQSLNYSLLSRSERKKRYIEFSRESLLQGDTAARVQMYQGLFSVGAVSPNQIARKENLPGSGTEGDKRFVPMNFIPLELAVNPPEAAPSEPAVEPPSDEPRTARALAIRKRYQDANMHSLKRAAERYVRQEAQAVRAAMRKATGATRLTVFQSEMDALWLRLPESIHRDLSPVLHTYFDLLIGALEDEVRSFTPAEREHLIGARSRFEKDLASAHVQASTDMLRDAITSSQGDWAAIEQCVSAWEATRANTIAETTAERFTQHIARSAYTLWGMRLAA